MIRRLKVLYELFKNNPTVMYCRVCHSLNLELLHEVHDNDNYTANIKCNSCGATVNIKASWKKNG